MKNQENRIEGEYIKQEWDSLPYLMGVTPPNISVARLFRGGF